MATTALVAAITSFGISARRLENPLGSRRHGEKVAVVDLADRPEAMPRVAAALSTGMSVVVLSEDSRSPRVAAAMAGGAAGWVSTREPVDELVGALHEVQAGRPIVSAEDRRCWVALDRGIRMAAEARAALLDQLTDREFAVLRMLERGMVAAEVATANIVALSTVRTQIRSILRRLAVNSQDAAVRLYREALAARADRL